MVGTSFSNSRLHWTFVGVNMDEMVHAQERTLTVTNYVEQKGGYIKKRVTIALNGVEFVIAGEDTYETIENNDIRQVNVVFGSGSNLELYISLLDLMNLERAVGMYFAP